GYDDKFEFVSSAYRLRKSACFLRSAGSLTCTRCHDPHDTATSPAAGARYTRACLECHGSAVRKMIGVGRHTNSQRCVSCHMPKRRPSDAIHVLVTDHRIGNPPTAAPAQRTVELHEDNAPPYRGEVALYYPPRLTPSPESELYLALAQVKQQSNPEQG